jgi:hypothetical protein
MTTILAVLDHYVKQGRQHWQRTARRAIAANERSHSYLLSIASLLEHGLDYMDVMRQ